MISEKQYNQMCGKILAGKPLNDDDANNFMQVLTEMEGMLDEADSDDYYGTQGWRYHFGWED